MTANNPPKGVARKPMRKQLRKPKIRKPKYRVPKSGRIG
jgi:hypothetical protein